MMDVMRFERQHVAEAAALAQANYAEACETLPVLPRDARVPDLGYFAESGMGSAAFAGGRMVGFLAGVAPFEGLFGPVRGTFSPLHAHGAVGEGRERIYALLYEHAAAQWVAQGATSHAVVLYACESASIHAFFVNGFGMRTMDAIRPMERIALRQALPAGVVCVALPPERFGEILPLHNGLTAHLQGSPLFVPVAHFDGALVAETLRERDSRIFAALAEDRVIGYMEVMSGGENFITAVPEMPNICGAFLAPAYRGRGVYDALLDHTIATLQGEGFSHLGVDFEGFNPAARGFWLRYFTAYTYGVTRRVDERILGV